MERISFLATERIAEMRTSCKARRQAIDDLRVLNEWIARYQGPYEPAAIASVAHAQADALPTSAP